MGVSGPEGLCPVGPISQKTLLQLHCEKLVGINRRCASEIPFLIMTSAETGEETRNFLQEHRFFNLPKRKVLFLDQPRLPLVDRRGKIVMNSRFEVAMAPNGHGGAFGLMQEPAMLERLKEWGVKHLFYFQVDNPCLQIADPVFLGYHIQKGAEISAKAVRKVNPNERVGVFSQKGSQLAVIEYSDLTQKSRQSRDPNTNELEFSAGNMAIHIFSLDFLEQTRGEGYAMPYHPVEHRMACLDRKGNRVQPSTPNCFRFECFIFDVFPWAQNSVLVEADRGEEFYPLGAKHGRYSPEEARQAISEKYALWLEYLGMDLPRDEAGNLLGVYEVSPLFALDREEFKEKSDVSSLVVGDSLYME